MVLGYPPEDVRQFIINHRPLPYDAQVEYLESTGTQWIDTGIVGSATLEISCRFKKSDTNTGTARLVYGAYVNTAYILGLGGVNTSSYFTWNSLSLSQSCNVLADTDWHDTFMSTVLGDKFVKFDGVNVATSTGTVSKIGTMPIILFGRNPNLSTATRTLTPCCISSFSVKDHNTNQLIIDFIPVRFTNEHGVSEGAMYDRIGVGGMNPDGSPRNDGLYRNQGTGSFLFGDDV